MNREASLILQEKLGRRIRAVRRERRFTQSILASFCGLHVSHVSKIERGEANVTISTLLAIATALKIDLAELLREVSPAAPRQTSEPILADRL